MRIARNIVALVRIVLRRCFSHLPLLTAVWLGLALVVGLVVSIPIYAEATGYRILQTTLAAAGAGDNVPPFSMVYSYGNAGTKPISWTQFQQADALASNLNTAGIALPVHRVVRYGSTDQMRMLLPGDQGKELLFARLAFLSDLQPEIQLIDGAWPNSYRREGPIEVLVSAQAASEQTLLVGDVYDMRTTESSGIALVLPVRIAGIWRPLDPRSDYWFNPPSTYSRMLLIPEESFAAAIDNPSVNLVDAAAWYTAFDSTAVRSAAVPSVITTISSVSGDIQRLVPGVELTRSPTAALISHRDQVRLLTINLALFSVPLLGMLAAFTAQVAGTLVQQQQQEIAVLRSRGSSRSQVVFLALGEGLVISCAALFGGLPLGVGLANVLSWTNSFLRFAPQPGPQIGLLESSWLHGAFVVALLLPALALPAWAASRRTVISFKQERARQNSTRRIQQILADIVLLLPALYGYRQLQLGGMLSVPGVALPADDPFRNPLLLLAPALFVFALALLVLHTLPLVLQALSWLLARLPGVGVLLALRFLARSTRTYAASILLIALTLSLATFSASLAHTLDGHSLDRIRYQAAADARLVPKVIVSDTSGQENSSSGGDATSYLTLPVDEYLTVPGVQAVTRAVPSDVSVVTGGTPEQGIFLGVDPSTLPGVLADSWRDSYASVSLGELMNRLAEQPDAALVSASYASQHGLRDGDHVTLQLSDLGTRTDIVFTIVGSVDYFPSLYPEAGPFFIGNLDYSADQQGSMYPYQLWLDTAPGTSLDPIKAVAFGHNLDLLDDTPAKLLDDDTLRPERQGLFGLLSVGFLAAALVAVLGFLISTLVSFGRRLVELGMLRAIGLSTAQLATLLLCEQTIVIGVGTGLGTGLGVLASTLFLPFMHVRTGTFPGTPPFQVQIAWPQIITIYAATAGLLVITVVLTLVLLRRMHIFEAVKLGEAV